jgi:hypothetical protein
MLPTEANINELQNKIWYVVKQEDVENNDPPKLFVPNCSNDMHDIKINDIIKIGRVKYVVTEMKLNNKIVSIERNVVYPVFKLIYEYT